MSLHAPLQVLAALAGVALSALRPVAGQERPTVALTVIVSDGESVVASAEVRLRVLGRVVVTDASGRARLQDLTPGPHILEIRRLGFRPDTSEVLVVPADTFVRIVLQPNAQQLAAVSVVGRGEGFDKNLTEMLDRWMSGQYRRSSFISRAELEERNSLLLSDALRRTPGLRLERGRDGNLRAVSTRTPVRIRGSRCGSMNLYLNGVRTTETILDRYPITEIAGIEIYSSNATAPTQYNVTGEDCGVLLLWTKHR